ncbi:hypothetical protein [Chryseobacterium sp. RLHN22]|uniref:hypothetical protein n=1 Tax=Chryseobacterium sp. RLHN22 TaxID=3437885 RepID=UPI003D9B979F
MRLILIFILIISLQSCERIIEQNRFNSEQENYTSPYQGTWYGAYTGSSANSTFSLKVYKAGNVEVIRSSGNTSETFYGQVLDNGSLTSLYSQSSGFTMNGNLNTKSGTWQQGNLSGNWTVSKQ